MNFRDRIGGQKETEMEKYINRRTFLKSVPALAVLAAAESGFTQDANTVSSSTKELQPITLLKPETDGGKPEKIGPGDYEFSSKSAYFSGCRRLDGCPGDGGDTIAEYRLDSG